MQQGGRPEGIIEVHRSGRGRSAEELWGLVRRAVAVKFTSALHAVQALHEWVESAVYEIASAMSASARFRAPEVCPGNELVIDMPPHAAPHTNGEN